MLAIALLLGQIAPGQSSYKSLLGVQLSRGSVAHPSLSWQSDADTGFYSDGTANAVTFAAGGERSFQLQASGNLYGVSTAFLTLSSFARLTAGSLSLQVGPTLTTVAGQLAVSATGVALQLPAGTKLGLNGSNTGAGVISYSPGSMSYTAGGGSTHLFDQPVFIIGTSAQIGLDPVTLPTCNGGAEGRIARDVASGGSSGSRTRLCFCTNNGSGTYNWQNLATGTVGTTTACLP